MNHAEQFAERCWAVLEPILPELYGMTTEADIKKALAGSWLAFDAALKQQGKRGTNIPPAVEEVAAYLKEIGYNIDPNSFWMHYDTKGWKISGGCQMKSWHSAVQKWKANGWGTHLDKGGFGRTQQSASLGALQIELATVREQISGIVRPGGSAFARSASSISPGEMARYQELIRRKESLEQRINNF